MRMPLSPLQYFRRSADIYRGRPGVIDGERRLTYGEFAARCLGLAAGLRALCLKPGDRAALLAPNTHRALECYYAVPLAAGVLVPLNIRLTLDDYRYILTHSGCRLLIADPEFMPAAQALAQAVPVQVVPLSDGPPAGTGWMSSEQLIARAAGADHAATLHGIDSVDEETPITINYTSGTTARPKGVMLTHRLTALNVLDFIVHGGLTAEDVYLHTLPMFHVNGWGGVWAITAAGARHVCLPRPDPAHTIRLIDEHGVTMACAAPTVLVMLGNDPGARGWRPKQTVRWYVGGAPPPAALIVRAEELGFQIVHVYGLTETGPWLTVCEWRREWDALSARQRAALKARQGIGQLLTGQVRVARGDLSEVARDGAEVGEIVVRGPTVMAGYYRDQAATEEAWRGGWFHTGDLAVMHPDGYIQIVDRKKDLIVSGGENISSVEIEGTLYQHPDVLEAAVVAAPDATWGEVPKAIVVCKPGAQVTEAEIIGFCRDRLAHFKAPKLVEFANELPKTATGKIQKYLLRRAALTAKHDH
jgi:fatty-acyl-CoA synthase